jgi:hypothetical protein
MIVIAVLYGFAALLAWVAQPGIMGLMFVPWYVPEVPVVVALVCYFLGLAWMVRIYRADQEPDTGSWRYRNF